MIQRPHFMTLFIVKPDTPTICAETDFSGFLPPDNGVHRRSIRQILEIGMLLIIDARMSAGIIENHSEADNPHPVFIIARIKHISYGNGIIKASYSFHTVNAKLLILRLNLTDSTAKHAYPHLIVVRAQDGAHFIVRQFSNAFFGKKVLERIEIGFIVHNAQPATGTDPNAMRLILTNIVDDIIEQRVFFTFHPMKPVILHTTGSIRSGQPQQSSVPCPDPNLLFVVLIDDIREVENLIDISVELFLLHVIAEKPFFTCRHPDISPIILYNGRDACQPLAWQVNTFENVFSFFLSEKSTIATDPNIPVFRAEYIRRVQGFQFIVSDTLYVSGKFV